MAPQLLSLGAQIKYLHRKAGRLFGVYFVVGLAASENESVPNDGNGRLGIYAEKNEYRQRNGPEQDVVMERGEEKQKGKGRKPNGYSNGFGRSCKTPVFDEWEARTSVWRRIAVVMSG